MQKINITIDINLHDDIYAIYDKSRYHDEIKHIIENEVNRPYYNEYSGLESWIIDNHRKYVR